MQKYSGNLFISRECLVNSYTVYFIPAFWNTCLHVSFSDKFFSIVFQCRGSAPLQQNTSPRTSQGGGPREPIPLHWPGRLPMEGRSQPPLQQSLVNEVTGLFRSPSLSRVGPAPHPKSPFAVTSYDLRLKQDSMNNVTCSFFSPCLQILRG